MNTLLIVFFIISLKVFLFFAIVFGKFSIRDIVTNYFKNYYPGALKETDRKFSATMFVSIGLLPYGVGALMFWAFKETFLTFNVNLLCQIDIVFLTIFCLFLGMDLKRDGNEVIRKELNATLLINILLVVFAIISLLIVGSINLKDSLSDAESIVRDIFLTVFYAFNIKILSLLFYSLKRIFVLSK